MSATRFWEFPIGDELVVARPGVHGLFLLNSTARLIWTEARHNVPPPDIAASLVNVYGIPFHQALHDINAVLSVIEVPPGPPPPQPVAPSPTPTRNRHYRLGGQTFRISTDSPDLEAEIHPRLEPLQVHAEAADIELALFDTAEAFTLWHGSECVGAEDSVAAIRAVLLQEMVRLTEPGRQWLALLHAGACALDGRCVIFPAGSHSGKTTLAAVLMRHGFSLLSDDFVGLERGTLRIPPMPFALAIREGSWPVLATDYPGLAARPTVDRFGERVKFLPPPSVAGAPAQAAAIVVATWSAGADTSLEALTPFETLVALKASGFWVEHHQPSIELFLQWLQSVPSYRLAYSDASSAVRQIRSIMEAPP